MQNYKGNIQTYMGKFTNLQRQIYKPTGADIQTYRGTNLQRQTYKPTEADIQNYKGKYTNLHKAGGTA